MFIEVKQFTDYFTREEFISIFLLEKIRNKAIRVNGKKYCSSAVFYRNFGYKISDLIMMPFGYWESRAVYPKDELILQDSYHQGLVNDYKECIALKVTLLDETNTEHVGFALVACVADFIKTELQIEQDLARALASYILIVMIENKDF